MIYPLAQLAGTHQYRQPRVDAERRGRDHDGQQTYNPAIDVLFLCTGNICRSPMAEVLLRRALEVRDVPGRVHSAGLSFDDRPASPGSVKAMAARGLDLSDHRSRIMTANDIATADLVVAMERAHVREAAVLAPERFNRVFTLKELVRRASAEGPRSDQPLEGWLARLAEGRNPVTLLGSSSDDDVKDPIGQSQKRYDECAVELDQLVRRMADLVWGPVARGRLASAN